MPYLKELRKFKRSIHKRFNPEIERFPKMPYPTIDVVYWRPPGSVNFGDELGRTIVSFMLARKGISIFDETSRSRRFLGVGSILDHAETDTVVWGSGRSGSKADRAHFFDRLDVRAVRGPRTRDFLLSKGFHVPEIFGDPALLLPTLTNNRFVCTREKDVVFVPNLNDYQEKVDFSRFPVPVLDPRQSWNKVITEILRHKLVLASSLHALVIADAWGIPARYVRLTEREHLFKYHDYYEGSGRTLGDFAHSAEEGLEMGGKELPVFDENPLLESFPYDIWLK